MEPTGPGTGYDTKHHFRQPQSADKLEHFRRHLRYRRIGNITIFLLILAIALFFHGIYLTLATEDLVAWVAFKIIGSFIGAAFLWRRGGILWVIESHTYALERNIKDDEGDFQMDEIKRAAEEINIEILAVFCGGS
ncbi:hypothetical protein EDB80DRAFT_873587 [Ilyonectria destructans]|nr:hypothetical protein EDB80DRAFT_873587 [Ilyonectria destructans]